MKRSLILVAAIACMLSVGLIHAQGLGGLFKRSSNADAPTGLSVEDAFAQGGDMLHYLTIATDLGMKAVDTIIEVFPPEKVENVRQIALKYNEAKSQRKEGNLDVEQLKMAGDASKELANLEGDWQSYQKEKASVIPKAHSQLGLMLLADAQALAKAPETLQALQNTVQTMSGNPMMLGKAVRLKSMISVLVAVPTHVPAQTSSFKQVRTIAKNIAEAEKMTLAPDPPADKVKDTAMIEQTITEIE